MDETDRDRPKKFACANLFNYRDWEETQSGEDIELSLGLSLNGRFGVDPRANKRLCRSASIPDFLSSTRENGSIFAVPYASGSDLVRTSSLPTETDEQWRQRKEIQMLRRMEAKRKRSEKQRNLKAAKDTNKDFGETSSENGYQNSNGSFGTRSTVTDPSPQGSIGSQGSGSSTTSEFETNPLQGMNNRCNIEARTLVSVQSLSEREQKFIVTPKSNAAENPIYPPATTVENKATIGNGVEKTKNILEDMPCVSTKGDGPSGKRIEGFLYRYKKGEEVRIVCVCHGSFLSPAEFVKHAGGGDVTHPLKHIVVNPYPVI